MAQPFTRLPLDSFPPASRQVLSDIYDKLAAALSAVSTTSTPVTPITPTVVVTPQGTITPPSGPVGPQSIQDAIGRAANPQYAYLPDLKLLPTVNPTAGLPYTQDGLALLVAPTPTSPDGLIYRYDLSHTSWVYQSGTLRGILSTRPTPTASGDTGLRFQDIITGITYRWNGDYWDTLTSLGTALSINHLSRVATGTVTAAPPSGTVSTIGTAVTWGTGTLFDNNSGTWVGKTITIFTSTYTIVDVTSTTTLTIDSSAGVSVGVAYAVDIQQVVHTTGTNFDAEWIGAYASIDFTLYSITAVNPDVLNQSFYTSVDVPSGTYTWSLFQYSAANYPAGAQLYEKDRAVTYIVKDATGIVDTTAFTGTVNTSGTAVTWTGGSKFDTGTAWSGLTITIATVDYVIASVNSDTTLTLTATAGVNLGAAYSLAGASVVSYSSGMLFDLSWFLSTPLLERHMDIAGVDGTIYKIVSNMEVHVLGDSVGTGLAYMVTNGAWWYDSGVNLQADNTTPPTDLTYTDKGFRCRSALHQRTWLWNNGDADTGGGSPGWHYADGDVGCGAIIAALGTVPSGGYWHRCDGTTTDGAADDMGTVTLPTPDTTVVGLFIQGGNGGATTPTAASRATWETTAKTDDEALHTHSIVDNINVTLGGGVNNAAAAQTTSAGSDHHHVLSDANAQLKLFSETNGGLPERLSFTWWMRR